MPDEQPIVTADEAQRAVSRQQADWAAPSAVQACSQLCWIEVHLLDADDLGVPREPYRIRLPDGSVRNGKLNDDGWFRLDGIPCGECAVWFPRINRAFVKEPERYPPEKRGSLDLLLLTEDNEVVPDLAYAVTLPDGSMVNGTLNAKGRARLDGIPLGECKVRFSALDAREVLAHTHG